MWHEKLKIVCVHLNSSETKKEVIGKHTERGGVKIIVGCEGVSVDAVTL